MKYLLFSILFPTLAFADAATDKERTVGRLRLRYTSDHGSDSPFYDAVKAAERYCSVPAVSVAECQSRVAETDQEIKLILAEQDKAAAERERDFNEESRHRETMWALEDIRREVGTGFPR